MSTRNGNTSVVWARTGLRFELESNDATVRNRAATIFRPWPAIGNESIVCRWRLDRCFPQVRNTRNVWEVEDDTEVIQFQSLEDALRAVEYGSVFKCLRRSGQLSIHGALLSKDGNGVVIVGPCEAGKSTLSTALWQRGWSFLCDDITFIDPKRYLAFPSPRRVSLRPGSRALLGEELWSRILSSPSYAQTEKSCVFHPCEVDGITRPDSTELRAVIFLARQGISTEPAVTRRIEPAHALLAMLPYSNLASQIGAGQALKRIQPLAEHVAAFDLGRGELRSMADRIEEIVL